MTSIARPLLTALLVIAPACLAQKWEVGGIAGGGFSNGLAVSNAIGSATAGFVKGLGFGAGAHRSGWLHHLAPMVGVTFV